MYEVEQKYAVEDIDAVRSKLIELGAADAHRVTQVDQYFAHPGRDFADTDEALRIRRVGEHNFVTYKGPKIDSSTKTRRELEIAVESGTVAAEKFVALLEALSFAKVAEVRKVRRVMSLSWENRHVEIALDEVDSLGAYLELELTADDSDVDRARELIGTLAERLDMNSPERRSYLEMLLSSDGG